MAKAKAKPKDLVPQTTLISARKEGLLLLTPIQAEVEKIEIRTEHDYMVADKVRTRIVEARRAWSDRMTPIIQPIRAGLDLLYELNRDIDRPFGTAQDSITAKMKDFKLLEARENQERERKRLAEIKRLADEEAEKAAAQARARTNPMKDILAQKRAEIQQQRVNLENTVEEAPLKVAGSNTRTVKKWKVTDLKAFILSFVCAEGESISLTTVGEEHLLSLVQINTLQMNAKFLLDAPEPGEWMPGVECYEDITIATTRRS